MSRKTFKILEKDVKNLPLSEIIKKLQEIEKKESLIFINFGSGWDGSEYYVSVNCKPSIDSN